MPASESVVAAIDAASIVILLDAVSIALHTDSTHTYVDRIIENLDAICKNKPTDAKYVI
jgi:precorrin-6x reductase